MKFSDYKTTIMIDASGLTVKAALGVCGKTERTFESDGQSMESCVESLANVCRDFSQVEAFAICTGPGSVLGTRVASAAVATIAMRRNAEIFEFDSLKTYAHCAETRAEPHFAILAASRKGFANVVNFDGGKIVDEIEIPVEEIPTRAYQPRKLIVQRAKSAPLGIPAEEFLPTPTEIFETLMRHPALAVHCDLPPDAKSLTKREYVKWKAQAHI